MLRPALRTSVASQADLEPGDGVSSPKDGDEVLVNLSIKCGRTSSQTAMTSLGHAVLDSAPTMNTAAAGSKHFT